MEYIIQFLTIPLIFKDGNGDGDGNGYGNGDRNGNGYGDGNGDGNGNGDGIGYGDGNGNGYGDGDGNGYGYGYGHRNGNGNGYGNGNGNGNGNGDGLKSLNNQTIYIVDNIQTIITSVKGNIAQGFIINDDLSLTKCYIAKGENQFSHGSSIKDAINNLRNKLLINSPIEERINKFKIEFPKFNIKYKASDLYNWHYLLTGSCNLGRQSFIKNNNINLKKDKFTIKEFISLTKNHYGSYIIVLLEKVYTKDDLEI